MSDEDALEVWIVAVWSAYKLTMVEHLRRLRGEPVRTLDDRAMHPFSEMIGRANAMQLFLPELAMLELHPLDVMAEARQVARDTYGEEWAKEHGYR